MGIAIVYETHATTVDNEVGRATGWLAGELSGAGREQARELGERRRDDGIAAEMQAGRRDHLDHPYPGGESWRQAVERVGRLLGDLPLRWEGQRVLVVGHVATRWALDHYLGGAALEDLAVADFAWRPGWEYQLG